MQLGSDVTARSLPKKPSGPKHIVCHCKVMISN